MQIFENDSEISLEEFNEKFSDYGHITSSLSRDLTGKIIIEGEKISYQADGLSPLFIDINKSYRYHQKTFVKRSKYKDPMARALGIKPGNNIESVLDATGGFLADTLLIKSIGVKNITVFERHPIPALLIKNALSLNPIEGIDFHFSDVYECNKKFDVVYYDPMYDNFNVKAAPKKEMQILRALECSSEKDDKVFDHLLSMAIKRLVVKRSIKAPPIRENPQGSILGKSTRYDIYF